MEANYQPFIDRLIAKYEGGYCWDRRDPGGPTNMGVTCYDLAENRGQKMTSMAAWSASVKQMAKPEAEDIYRKKYAKGIRFDELKSGIDVCMLDYAVNSGVARPLYVACGLLNRPMSSTMSNELLDAINAVDADWFIGRMCAERLRFMHTIRGGKAWIEFGKGWLARVTDLRTYATYLAHSKVAAAPEAPDLAKTVTPKATHVPKTAGSKTSMAVVAAGAAAHSAGANWWIVAAVCCAVILIGTAYEAWQEKTSIAANLTVHA